MSSVYWLEQTASSLPSVNDWLSRIERRTLDGFRVPKRRADWRLGRWTAKQALSSCLDLPRDPQTLTSIEIRPAPSGAPEAFLVGAPAPVTISLSHSKRRAVCAIAHGKIELGCDLEAIEVRDEAFVRDYFTAEEQEWIEQVQSGARATLVTLLWSAKESALKALSAGLRVDTRSLIVSVDNEMLGALLGDSARDPVALPGGLGGTWKPLQVRPVDNRDFRGWWMCADDLVRTVVAAPEPGQPIILSAPPLVNS